MQRHQRLEEDIKIAISEIILRDVKNPNIEGIISITSVELTQDQKYAKVYVSIFNAKDKQKVLNALKKSLSFVRYELGKKVKLRYVPAIELELDNSMEYGEHMDRVINSLKNDENEKR